jgi:hypothetical protein
MKRVARSGRVSLARSSSPWFLFEGHALGYVLRNGLPATAEFFLRRETAPLADALDPIIRHILPPVAKFSRNKTTHETKSVEWWLSEGNIVYDLGE